SRPVRMGCAWRACQRSCCPSRADQVEDLSRKAELAAKLRDQLQEYRHTAEKLQKSETAKEKYKKRLEEAGDLRRQVKVSLHQPSRQPRRDFCAQLCSNPSSRRPRPRLFFPSRFVLAAGQTLEEQNFILAEKNQQLEEEYRKVSAFKPMMESY